MKKTEVIQRVNDEDCLTILAAARRKKVSRSAIWLACRSGRLKFHQVGERIFIPLAELARYTPDPQALSRGKAAASARA